MLQRLQEQARKRQRTAAEVIDLTGDEGESNANRRRRSDTENASGSRRQQGSPCFHLLRVEGNPRQPPCLSTTLQDLVSQGENLKKALVSNFLIDTGWLVQQFPTLMHCEELIVAHDGRCQVDQAGKKETDGDLGRVSQPTCECFIQQRNFAALSLYLSIYLACLLA